jgi:hypothetical protein
VSTAVKRYGEKMKNNCAERKELNGLRICYMLHYDSMTHQRWLTWEVC